MHPIMCTSGEEPIPSVKHPNAHADGKAECQTSRKAHASMLLRHRPGTHPGGEY